MSETDIGMYITSTSTTILTSEHLDRRNPRGRFSWVRRLMQGQHRHELPRQYQYQRPTTHNVSDYSDDESNDNESNDNVSTIPLKSVVSSPSTTSPSVLSNDQNNDSTSLNASTAETSIAPSSGSHLNPHVIPQERDRDSESIVTIASSTRRIRRRSLETMSSTAGIPPASIMERIQPYANSDRDLQTSGAKSTN